MRGEFDLIRRFFETATPAREDVLLGVGDDCALLAPAPGRVLAVSSDTLVCGRHFHPDVDPESLGHKALAVNLSDLAAMGAEPAWVSLCLTLPEADEAWLASFMRGFSRLAVAHGVALIGGDTTCGPLSVSITVHGHVEPDRALRRDAARPGDAVYVTGTLGDAGLALRLRAAGEAASAEASLMARLDRPEPRVRTGRALAGLVRCAIDISDGLGADLGHICARSGVGAELDGAALPLSPAVRARVERDADWMLPLASGDDYELLVCAPPSCEAALEQAGRDCGTPLTRIGRIVAGAGVRMHLPDGNIIEEAALGHEHFSD